MLLKDFSGGQNVRVAPSLLQPNESQVYTNLDNVDGSLTPIKSNTLDTVSIDKYFTWYYAQNKFIGRSTESSFVEYKNLLYLTRFEDTPQWYDGTNYFGLGIVNPSVALTISNASSGSVALEYVYTYYNIANGHESAPNPISNTLAGIDSVSGANIITVDGITASTDSQVTNVRLYRLGDTITQYTLVETLSNTTAQYLDSALDTDIAGNTILDTYKNLPAPSGLKYLTEAYAMFFGVIGDKLYYSNIGEVAYWPTTNFIDFDSDITGIGVIQNGLIVFTKFKTFIVTGNSPETFSKYPMDLEQGCLSHYTIKFTANQLIWLSQDGICTTTGGNVEVLSLAKLGKLTLTGIQNAAVLDRVYYLAHDAGILVYDFRYNVIVRNISTIVNRLGSYRDTLFAQINTSIHSMLTGEAMEYTYRSPILTEGLYSSLKTFKDFYIKYNGDITINLYVDGVLTNTKLLVGDSTYNLKALASSDGYGLEIEIIGTGIVSEIEFKALGRQNGR